MPFIAYPSGNMLQNMTLTIPSVNNLVNPALAFQQGYLMNVDNIPVPYNPCIGLCNMNGVQAVVGNPFQTGATHLGAVVTAPQYYVRC